MKLTLTYTRDSQSVNKLLKLIERGNWEVGIFDEEVAAYATVQEYGSISRNIPSRSFMRSTYKEQLPGWVRYMGKQSELAARKKVPLNVEILLSHMVQDVVKKVDEIQHPPLKPATVAAKGSPKPLIDTGKLRESITYMKGTNK